MYLRKHNPGINRKQIIHRILSICIFLAFNIFYIYGGHPENSRMGIPAQQMFNSLVMLVSTLWLYRNWRHSLEQYKKKSIANKLYRQLKKLNLNFTRILKNRSLDQLKADELDILAQKERLRITSYREVIAGMVQELVDSGMPLPNAIALKIKQIKNLKQEYCITKQENLQVLSVMIDNLRPKVEAVLALWQEEAFRDRALSNISYHSQTPIFVLLHTLLSAKQQLKAIVFS